jgi:hypothetical protein
VTAEPRLTFVDHGAVVWEETISNLAEIWTKTFREVVK